jgi:hypothetical protein
MFVSISHLLTQVPCLHRGSRAGLPLIPPPFPIVIMIHPPSPASLPLPAQPACCSVSYSVCSFLLPSLRLCSSLSRITNDMLLGAIAASIGLWVIGITVTVSYLVITA